jgi:hypothetical protein
MLGRGTFSFLLFSCLVAGAEPPRHAAAKRANYIIETARATNDANELLVTQMVYRTHKFLGFGYLLKFSPDGKRLVRRPLGRGAFPRVIQVTPGGDLYLAGDFLSRGSLRGFRTLGHANGYSGFAARLDPDFHFRWMQPLKGGEVTGSALASGTNFAVVGMTLAEVSIGSLTATNPGLNTVFGTVINPQGEPQSLWVTDQLGASIRETMLGVERIHIAGFFESNSVSFGGSSTNFTRTNACAYVASYSLEGGFQWVVLLEATEMWEPVLERFGDIELRPTSELGGDIMVSATFAGRGAPGTFTIILKSDGTVLYRSVLPGPLIAPPPWDSEKHSR